MRLTWAFAIDSVPMTKAVIDGTASLGGSESACLGLARALVKRGHRVCIFTTKLAEDAPEVDHAGVRWYPASELTAISRFIDWDVFVALRQSYIFNADIRASYRILWNQDLMVGEPAKLGIMSTAWAYDRVAYVSQYHRKQWEGVIPELAPIGWVTKNGYDPDHVPTSVVKKPHQIIHITRPERGLRPLLAMWPELKRRVPEATLALCRYESMYDGEGSQVRAMVEAYDRMVEAVNAEVGGITFLGKLGKPDLYRAIAESAVMWYPGVADFAETSCVAAIEAQACGTPFVGSYKGALPETVPHGVLIRGDADSPEYQAKSIEAVCELMDATRLGSMPLLAMGGLQHVQSYTYDAIAAEWESSILDAFSQRVTTRGRHVLARLLHEDDHVAAQVLAREMGDTTTVAFCQRVIDGLEQQADDYADRAMDPEAEIAQSPRVGPVCERLAGRSKVLDLACGNGAHAIALALANPEMRIVAVDYADGNIAVAAEAARRRGVADRITFICAPVYDFETHQPTDDLRGLAAAHGPFDAAFVGEFLEHIANVPAFLSAVHAATSPGARIVATMPSGPFEELAQRGQPVKKGHVHHFRPVDLLALFGEQTDLDVGYLDVGYTYRGSAIGHWLVSYTPSGAPIGERPIAQRILTTRPLLGLSVGILVDQVTDIRTCLASIWPVADEILLGDTGAGMDLAAVADEFAPKARVVPVGRVHDLHGGFAEARNTVLAAATGHWFLWIDSDEKLLRGERLWRYLEGGVFNGYALKQNHLMVDIPNTFDTPVRIFRRQEAIQFYGCIHEQPQMGDCNGDITPALQLNDVEIAHFGYLLDEGRKRKALERNLPLLIRDQEVYADRRLGKLLVLRDCLNLATWSREAAGGRLTEEAKTRYQQVIALFEKHFFDPADKFHALARPFYEAAVKEVDGAFEVELAFVAKQNGLRGGRARPERVWVRRPEHLATLLADKQREWLKPLEPWPAIDVEPVAVDVPEPEGAPV